MGSCIIRKEKLPFKLHFQRADDELLGNIFHFEGLSVNECNNRLRIDGSGLTFCTGLRISLKDPENVLIPPDLAALELDLMPKHTKGFTNQKKWSHNPI